MELSNNSRRPARAAKRTSEREEWLECIRHHWPMRHSLVGRALILYAIGQARGRRAASLLSKPNDFETAADRLFGRRS